MSLSDMLFKYDSNMTLKVFLNNAIDNPSLYARIGDKDGNYEIIPTNLFLNAMVATSASVVIDKDYKLVECDCGCLQFYKNKECIHTIALYAIGLMIINRDFFDKEYNEYQNLLLKRSNNLVLDSLATTLKISNPYFGLVHLMPLIEMIQGEYVLSIKIGLDKDYIIKDIREFIDATENNKELTYGQKLSFVHSYECFDEVSKEMYSFLRSISSENSSKCITLKKSLMLKVLEIYLNNNIYFRQSFELRPSLKHISLISDVSISLDSDHLRIIPPYDTDLLLSGVKRAYFIGDNSILAYPYKSRLEDKVIEHLFKINGELDISINSDKFITNVLPLIRSSIQIDDSFYKKYPIPVIKINSYLSYNNEVISLTPKIKCNEEDRTSPYIKELLDSYLSLIDGYRFAKGASRSYVITDIQDQYMLLTSDLSQIKSFGEIYYDESMKKLKAKKSKRTGVNISYNVGLLDFTFENSDLDTEDLEAMLNAYHQNKRFVRLKNDTILEIDDESAKEIDNFLEDFNISLKDLKKPIKKPLNYLLKLINGVDTNLVLDDEIVKMITTIQNYKKSSYLPNDVLKNNLRSYQIEGFKWLKTLAHFGFGGILADDMGLGKTIEIISFILSDDVQKPSLIVCPMSLVYNWENECIKWNLDIDVRLILGSSEDRMMAIHDINPNRKVLYITSYDSLRRDIALYESAFRFIIADEAQFIKNQFAQKSEAIKSLKSDINFALTGTPIENGLQDLWSIFDFLMPGYLSNYSHFKSRYESLIVHDDEEALDNLKKRISPFILRRTKKDVLDDLPEKIEECYYYKMSPKQKEVYENYVKELRDDISVGGNNLLALLTRLRQICITPELITHEHCDDTKIDMAMDIIKSSIQAGHRILLFSQFAQLFPIISKELDDVEIKHFVLDGTTKAKVRMEMVEEFNSNEEIKVFVISLKAGGTGLNLVGADTVIHMDPWWNVSAELQASDRAYRIGQTRNVNILRLICKDTIEEKVLELQAIKRGLADSIVEEGGHKLSKQDILDLLD